MSLQHWFTDVLLWIGVGLELFSCLGLLVMRSVYDRLHLSSPAALGVVFIAAAVVVDKSFSMVGNKAILIAVLAVIGAPLITHALGRMARIVQRGDWRLGPDENVEVEDR
jgi:monovalent cation/proton antiporter MnhG/PhaG subunit